MLDPKRLGVAGGILWGAVMFICTLLALFTGYSQEFLQLMASIYPGYGISFGGAFIGFIYGFIDAAIGLYILAWLYNRVRV